MQIDVIFNEWMRAIEMPWLTSLSKFIAVITDPYVAAVVGLIMGIVLYFRNYKKQAFLLVGSIGVSGVLLLTLKHLISRPRPLNSLVPEVGSAFPSGHAAIAVLFLGLMGYLFFRKQKLVTWVLLPFLILLTGFLRVYPRVHWLTDVLAGYLIGGIILISSILIYRKFESN
jgi:membrane-associated phospholipid phosphatase